MLLRVRRALFTLAVLSVLLAGCGDSTGFVGWRAFVIPPRNVAALSDTV